MGLRRAAVLAATLACALAPVASADPLDDLLDQPGGDPPCQMHWDGPTVVYEDGVPRYVVISQPQWVC